MSYREWVQEPGVVPAPIDGPFGRAWQAALGVLADALAEGARLAARCRWIAAAPEDALALHGSSRGWDRAPDEPLESYRSRLLKSWYLAEWAGTAHGIKEAFAALGLSNVQVCDAWSTEAGRIERADATVPERSRWFWVVVRHPHPFGDDFASRYGDGSVYGGGQQYGVNGDPRLLEALRNVVRKMKPANAYCEWIALVLAGDILTGVGSGDGEDGSPDGPSARVAYLRV